MGASIFACMEPVNFELELNNCLECLRNGGMLLFPTDTGWVMGIDATLDDKVEKLRSWGKTNSTQDLTILLPDEKDLLKYVSSLDLEIFNYLDQQETPVAVMFEGLVGVSGAVLNKDHMAPVRIAREDFSRHLLKRFRKPLAVIPAECKNSNDASYTTSDSVINHIFEPQKIVLWTSQEVRILHP